MPPTSRTCRNCRENTKPSTSSSNTKSSTKTVKGCFFQCDDLDESLSNCEWEQRESNKSVQRNRVKYSEDVLRMVCAWAYCEDVFDDYDKFIEHLDGHFKETEPLTTAVHCFWLGCNFVAPTRENIRHHIFYHGYYEKLRSHGANMERRTEMPACRMGKNHQLAVAANNQRHTGAGAKTTQTSYKFPLACDGYDCQWELCSEHFSTFYEFCVHVEMHVWHLPRGQCEGAVQCGWGGCGAGLRHFDKRSRLREHVRVHTQEKMVACPTCGTMFNSRTKFYDHRKRQMAKEVQSYLCSQCNKYFPSERLLKDHIISHINHYKCPLCEMTLSKPSMLAKHIRCKHIHDKQYQCQQCNFECVTLHNYKSHLKIHDESKRFHCDLCDFKCRSMYGLKKHNIKIHRRHSLVNIYECHRCDKRFDRGEYLTRHLMKEHAYSWPRGHNRFRYKLCLDGVFRLQTVRYETIDVTEEIIRSEMKSVPSNVDSTERYELKAIRRQRGQRLDQFKVCRENSSDSDSSASDTAVNDRTTTDSTAAKDEADSTNTATDKILITVQDVDDKGNVLHSEVFESSYTVEEDGMVEPSNSPDLSPEHSLKIDVD